jgi:hypothetical protein
MRVSRSAITASKLCPMVAASSSPMPAIPPPVEISTWSRSYTDSRMSAMPLRTLSGVMPFSALNAVCFSRRRLVSAIARSIEPVTVSA